MKLALVGTGRWAQNIIASLPPGVELTAVVSSRADIGALLVPPQRLYRDITDLPLDDLDGIIIANKASGHGGAAFNVWWHKPKMPLVIEKPFPFRYFNGKP